MLFLYNYEEDDADDSRICNAAMNSWSRQGRAKKKMGIHTVFYIWIILGK